MCVCRMAVQAPYPAKQSSEKCMEKRGDIMAPQPGLQQNEGHPEQTGYHQQNEKDQAENGT